MAKLPAGERAVVEMDKVTDYILSPAHPTGRHKARVFAASLGLTAVHAPDLEAALKLAAASDEAEFLRDDQYGAHYRLEFMMVFKERRRRVRSLWVVRNGEDFPRLVSAFIAPKDGQDG